MFINGSFNYLCNNVSGLYKQLISYKRKGVINIFTSITFNPDLNEINIYTDAGRCCRPLYILDNNTLRIKKSDNSNTSSSKINWSNLIIGSLNKSGMNNDIETIKSIKEGVIEYIDTEESEHTIIAMNTLDLKKKNINYKYCEIHPCLIFAKQC